MEKVDVQTNLTKTQASMVLGDLVKGADDGGVGSYTDPSDGSLAA